MTKTHNLILRVVSQKGGIPRDDLITVGLKAGKSRDAIRSAINRMTKDDILEKTDMSGRDVFLTIGPGGRAMIDVLIAKGLRWFESIAGASPWPGSWFLVSYSIPESRRSKRDQFRSHMLEIGFGRFSSGIMIHPFDREALVSEAAAALDVDDSVSYLVCGEIKMPGCRTPVDIASHIWNTEQLASRYESLNTAMRGMLEELKTHAHTDRFIETFFFRALDLQGEMIDIVVFEDPCLPVELLPGDRWPGREAHDLFHILTQEMSRFPSLFDRYEFLFHSLPGMEVFEPFHRDDQKPFHRHGDDE